MPSVFIFFGNKNILSRTKIYGSKLEDNLMLQRNNKLVWTWVNGQNFDIEQNYHLCCGYQWKQQSTTTFPWCIQHQLKYIVNWNYVRGNHGEQCWLVSKQKNKEKMPLKDKTLIWQNILYWVLDMSTQYNLLYHMTQFIVFNKIIIFSFEIVHIVITKFFILSNKFQLF